MTRHPADLTAGVPTLVARAANGDRPAADDLCDLLLQAGQDELASIAGAIIARCAACPNPFAEVDAILRALHLGPLIVDRHGDATVVAVGTPPQVRRLLARLSAAAGRRRQADGPKTPAQDDALSPACPRKHQHEG